jgi:hypothetical protein
VCVCGCACVRAVHASKLTSGTSIHITHTGSNGWIRQGLANDVLERGEGKSMQSDSYVPSASLNHRRLLAESASESESDRHLIVVNRLTTMSCVQCQMFLLRTTTKKDTDNRNSRSMLPMLIRRLSVSVCTGRLRVCRVSPCLYGNNEKYPSIRV